METEEALQKWSEAPETKENHTVRSKIKKSERRAARRARRGRLGRSEPNAQQQIQQQVDPLEVLSGVCEPGVCGADAACLTLGTGSYRCLCPHDAKPPTPDLKCPNRQTVPLTPKPIHNIIPVGATNLSGVTEAPTRWAGAGAGGALLAAAALLLCLLLMGGICWLRRRSLTALFCAKGCSRKDQPQQPRPGEPLLAERYIRNPQYIPCGADANAPRVLRLDRSALAFREEIGEGCFGKVYKGVLRRPNGEEGVVAVKVLKESAGRSAEDDFIREVSIMSAFQHPNILALIGVVYRDEAGASPWMVFEYMEHGDLAGVLRGATPLDARALLAVALQVARGMRYLAARRFVHRDLACRNCLVGAGLTVKIADFGMSRDVYTCDYYKMGGERPMPVRWMSPESIVYARFTLESDVWSYGVLLWEIYSRGKQPFYGHNNDGATKLILQGIMLIPPEDCPRFACELMRACWRSDPRDRIAFDEICAKLERARSAPLPRPPAAPPAPLDAEGYLLPATPPPAHYITPLPDLDSDSCDSQTDCV